MKIVIAYDIIETKTRNKIIEILFDFGFERVQNSIFIGEINKKKLKKIINLSEKLINRKEDSLYFFNLNKEEFNKSEFLGKIINVKYLNKNVLVL